MANQDDIQLLLDERAIQRCLKSYSRCCDRHDHDALIAAYHDDAIDERGGVLLSREQLWDRLEAVHHANWSSQMHNLLNCRIDVDGDVATAETYFMAAHRRKDGTGTDLIGGRYIDRLEKRAGEWRIARRRQVSEWSGALSPHPADHMMAKFSDVGERGKWDGSDISYER